MVADHAVMFDDAARVDDYVRAQTRMGVEHTPGHDGHALAQLDRGRDDGLWMYRIHDFKSILAQTFVKLLAWSSVADAAHADEGMGDTLPAQFRQHVVAAEHGHAHNGLPSKRAAGVQQADQLAFTRALQNVYDDFGVSPCAQANDFHSQFRSRTRHAASLQFTDE